MAIKVNVVAKSNPLDKEAPSKFYANAVHGKRVNLEEMSKKIAKRCSLREGDVYGVLIQMMVIFTEEVSEGNIVSLGELGSFWLNLSSQGKLFLLMHQKKNWLRVNIKYRYSVMQKILVTAGSD